MRSLAAGSIAALMVPAVASAQLGSARATPVSDVVQWLGLQEEVFPQDRGELQWKLGVALGHDGHEAIFASAIGLELGVAEGLEIQGEIPLEVGLGSSGRAGLGQSALGMVYGIVDEETVGLSLYVDNLFPARSGPGDDSYSHDAAVIAHYALAGVHAQVLAGVELQHGDALRAQRAEDVRVDPQGAIAIWVDLDTVAIAAEGAAEPDPRGMLWRVGPTLLWAAIRDLVLVAHANASVGLERPLYEGLVGAVLQAEVFR